MIVTSYCCLTGSRYGPVSERAKQKSPVQRAQQGPNGMAPQWLEGRAKQGTKGRAQQGPQQTGQQGTKRRPNKGSREGPNKGPRAEFSKGPREGPNNGTGKRPSKGPTERVQQWAVSCGGNGCGGYQWGGAIAINPPGRMVRALSPGKRPACKPWFIAIRKYQW